MSDENLTTIGIWGAIGSGKTSYLAALIATMKNRPDLWGIHPTALDRSDRQFYENVVPDFREGRLPASTDVQSVDDVRPLRYFISQRRPLGRERRIELQIFDLPGRLSLLGDTNEGAGVQYSDIELERAYFQHLASCDGLLLMIDPHPNFGAKGKTYHHAITRLLQNMRSVTGNERERLPHHICLCISKSDLDVHFAHRDEADKYAQAILGKDTWAQVTQNAQMRRVKAFSVSAVGRYTTPGGYSRPNIAPVVSPTEREFRIPFPEKWEPMNILQPIEWLLDRI